MKNLQGLLGFIEVAATGSLTAAAVRLDLTPAAVSKSLARLEQQLGVRLFNRSTRRLAITPEGQGFLEQARAALRLLDQAVAGVTVAAQEPTGRVRISVGISFGRRWLLPALPAIVARHPALAIDVDLDNRQVDLVAGGYDVGIRGAVVADSSLIARRICALPVVLVASAQYLRRAGVPASVDELRQHRTAHVRLPGSAASGWRLRNAAGRSVEWTPDSALTTTDPEGLIDLALADAGIVQTGLHHALPHLRTGRLKIVLPQLHDVGKREIVMHYPHRLYLAPRVRVVVDALLAHFQASPDLHLSVAEVLSLWPGWVAGVPVRRGKDVASPAKTTARPRRA